MINVLIADDEKLARQALQLQLARFPDLELVAACSDGGEVLRNVHQYRPDVLFLDIKMPIFSGLEVAQQLPIGYAPQLIFVTAYDEYALDAFDRQALDYLLKPFSTERFDKAFQRALDQIQLLRQTQEYSQHLRRLMAQIAAAQAHLCSSIITVRTGSRTVPVSVDQIDWIEADGDYIKLHTPVRTYLHSVTLTHLQQQLDPAQFVRIHRSVVIRLACVKETRSRYNGDYDVVLHSGQRLRLSRHYRSSLRGILL
jgi:two-component system LytT family response regulator